MSRELEGMTNLKGVKVGETVTVVKLHGEGAIKRRIMDMSFPFVKLMQN